MNEKYIEELRALNYGEWHQDLKGKWYPVGIMKKAAEDVVYSKKLQKFSITDKHISNNRDDAMRATMMWIIYYAVEKLGLKSLTEISFPDTCVEAVSYIAIAWLDDYAKPSSIESYAEFMTYNITPTTSNDLVPWFDRLNIKTITGNNGRCYNRYDDNPRTPLTNIYMKLRGDHLESASNFTGGCCGYMRQLINVFDNRRANAMSIHDSLIAYYLETRLLEYIAIYYPKDLINWFKVSGIDIRDSQYLPSEILAEAFYCLSYEDNSIINLMIKLDTTDPSTIISNLAIKDIVSHEGFNYSETDDERKLKSLIGKYTKNLYIDITKEIISDNTSFLASKKNTIKKIVYDNYDWSDNEDMKVLIQRTTRTYIDITNADYEDDIETKLDIRTMQYYDILSVVPSMIDYMTSVDDIRELPSAALAYMLVSKYPIELQKDSENGNMNFIKDVSVFLMDVQPDILDESIRDKAREVMKKLKNKWSDEH